MFGSLNGKNANNNMPLGIVFTCINDCLKLTKPGSSSVLPKRAIYHPLGLRIKPISATAQSVLP